MTVFKKCIKSILKVNSTVEFTLRIDFREYFHARYNEDIDIPKYYGILLKLGQDVKAMPGKNIILSYEKKSGRNIKNAYYFFKK